MNVNRRVVLKAAALASSAGLAMGGAIPVLASAPNTPGRAAQTVLVLANHSAAAALFLHGASAAAGVELQVQRASLDVDFMLELERQMRSGPARRIIGLLDDASATLVMDMARSAGAHLQWLGQHSAASGLTTHHHLFAADPAEQLRRLPLHNEASAQWAASLGYGLAALGTHTNRMAPLAPTANPPLSGSFVSFSIEV